MMQQTTTTLVNASSSVASSFNTAEGLVPVFLIVIAAALVFGMAASSYERFERLRKAVDWFAGTFEYAFLGFLTVAAAAIVAVPVYLLSQADGDTQTWVLGGAAAVAAGYFVLVGIGMAVKPVASRLVDHHNEYVAEHGTDDAGSDAEVAD